jgi:hypothetical protein
MLSAKANPAAGDHGVQKGTLSWRHGAEHKPSHFSRQAIRAELTGSDTCTAPLARKIGRAAP